MKSATSSVFCLLLMLACIAHAAAADAPPPVETKLPTHGSFAGTCPTFTPDGTALVYYDGSGIATWDIAQRKTVATIPTKDWAFMLSHDGTRISGLVFATVSRDGSRILTRYRKPDDTIVRVLDSKTLDTVATIGPLEKVVSWYAISPDNRYLAATAGGSPGIWDLSPDKPTSRPAGRARRR